MGKNSITRRGFLGAGLAGAASLSLPQVAFGSVQMRRKPKNVIWAVSDGMNASVPTLASFYMKATDGKESPWKWLSQQDFAVNGWQQTPSLSSLVTDSAAAGSSWGSGRHIWNGQLNAYPDGTQLKTLYQILGEHNVARGLVTTTRITHATPAAFTVSNQSRNNEDEIARQILDVGPEVIMGGGARHFEAGSRDDGQDVFGEYENAGYTVVRSRQELASASNDGKLLGLFSPSHIPYTIDQEHVAEIARQVPPIGMMTREAIQRLRNQGEGFVLQIEGGRVDHAGHANDYGAIIYDQLAFEEAVREAIEFALRDGETLVVVTSDHGTGSPNLNGDGDGYFMSTEGFEKISGMRRSYDGMLDEVGAPSNSVELRDAVEEYLGVELTEEQADLALRGLAGESLTHDQGQYPYPSNMLGLVLSTHTRVGWTTGNHTADWMMSTAVGPGAEMFGGVWENTSAFDKILSAYDLSHRNPVMTYEEAKRLMDQRQATALNAAVRQHPVA